SYLTAFEIPNEKSYTPNYPLLPILRPAAVDKFNYRLVHHERCRITLFPGSVDSHRTAIDGTGAHKALFAKQHVAGGIKASEDSPLKVFVVIDSDVGADRYDKPQT